MYTLPARVGIIVDCVCRYIGLCDGGGSGWLKESQIGIRLGSQTRSNRSANQSRVCAIDDSIDVDIVESIPLIESCCETVLDNGHVDIADHAVAVDISPQNVEWDVGRSVAGHDARQMKIEGLEICDAS